MPVSEVRSPRLLVLANGVPVPGAFAVQVTSTNHLGADRFCVRVALSADPRAASAVWSASNSIAIDVFVGIGGPEVNLVSGLVDRVTLDPVRRIALLDGRDRSALLIETRTRETFANQTSSDIALILTGRHGLAADIFPTTTPIGRYWQLEHDQTTLGQYSRATTEWDLLATLASREGFNVWVTGNILHFRPPDIAGPAAVVLRPMATTHGPATVTDLKMERALTFAGNIEVQVQSWSSRTALSCTQTATATRAALADEQTRRYLYVVPDLTPEAAFLLARRRVSELAGYERVVTADMPGDVTLEARSIVRVEATGSAFDQDYFVDTIERRLDKRGFTQTVVARNFSPDLEIQ